MVSLSTLEAAVGEADLARFGLGAPLADLTARFGGRIPGTEDTAGATRDFPRVIILSSKQETAKKNCIECRVNVRYTLGIRRL